MTSVGPISTPDEALTYDQPSQQFGMVALVGFPGDAPPVMRMVYVRRHQDGWQAMVAEPDLTAAVGGVQIDTTGEEAPTLHTPADPDGPREALPLRDIGTPAGTPADAVAEAVRELVSALAINLEFPGSSPDIEGATP